MKILMLNGRHMAQDTDPKAIADVVLRGKVDRQVKKTAQSNQE